MGQWNSHFKSDDVVNEPGLGEHELGYTRADIDLSNSEAASVRAKWNIHVKERNGFIQFRSGLSYSGMAIHEQGSLFKLISAQRQYVSVYVCMFESMSKHFKWGADII